MALDLLGIPIMDTQYSFPPPPVNSSLWTDRDWKRYMRRHGQILRQGPPPTVEFNGRLYPLARDSQGNILHNDEGHPLYDMTRPFKPGLPR